MVSTSKSTAVSPLCSPKPRGLLRPGSGLPDLVLTEPPEQSRAWASSCLELPSPSSFSGSSPHARPGSARPVAPSAHVAVSSVACCGPGSTFPSSRGSLAPTGLCTCSSQHRGRYSSLSDCGHTSSERPPSRPFKSVIPLPEEPVILLAVYFFAYFGRASPPSGRKRRGGRALCHAQRTPWALCPPRSWCSGDKAPLHVAAPTGPHSEA